MYDKLIKTSIIIFKTLLFIVHFLLKKKVRNLFLNLFNLF